MEPLWSCVFDEPRYSLKDWGSDSSYVDHDEGDDHQEISSESPDERLAGNVVSQNENAGGILQNDECVNSDSTKQLESSFASDRNMDDFYTVIVPDTESEEEDEQPALHTGISGTGSTAEVDGKLDISAIAAGSDAEPAAREGQDEEGDAYFRYETGTKSAELFHSLRETKKVREQEQKQQQQPTFPEAGAVADLKIDTKKRRRNKKTRSSTLEAGVETLDEAKSDSLEGGRTDTRDDKFSEETGFSGQCNSHARKARNSRKKTRRLMNLRCQFQRGRGHQGWWHWVFLRSRGAV